MALGYRCAGAWPTDLGSTAPDWLEEGGEKGDWDGAGGRPERTPAIV
jgi:hypothetical protein